MPVDGDREGRRQRVGALAEQNDEWTEGRRYLGLDILTRCRIRPVPDTETPPAEVTIPTLSAERITKITKITR